jgi:hypothetical protein
MPAHLHPLPPCRGNVGHPCSTCGHTACTQGGRLLSCEKRSSDKCYCFHAEYYLGSDVVSEAPTSAASNVRPAPTTTCTVELPAAQATLRKSQEVAETILAPGATSDMPYWFARLYQYITLYEIQDRWTLAQPCFLLHFIPIFYDTYKLAADAFMSKGNIPSHWQDHFTMAGLIVDPSQVTPWFAAVTRSLTAGVTAHIKFDMEPSLVKAYQSFSARYSGVPPFDDFKPDFFDRNKLIFSKVRVTLVNELVNRGAGMAAFGKSVDPNFASKAAEAVKMGLDIDEIYRWREVAWRRAKFMLGQ